MNKLILTAMIFGFIVTNAFGQNRKAKKAYDKGYEYHSIGNYHSAIDYYNEAILEYTQYGKAFFSRAECYQNLALNNKAKRSFYLDQIVSDLTNSIKYNTKRWEVVSSFRGRGDIHLYDNSFDYAVQDYYNALEYEKGGANPITHNLYFRIGLANYKQGKFEEALRSFREAESKYIKCSEYHYVVKGNTLMKLGRKREAVECYKLANESFDTKGGGKWKITNIGYCMNKLMVDEVAIAKRNYALKF